MNRFWGAWLFFFSRLAVFAYIIGFGHIFFIHYRAQAFEDFWHLPKNKQTLIFIGLIFVEQIIAFCLSGVLAFLSHLLPFRIRIFKRFDFQFVVFLFSAVASVGLVMICISHAANLYLGSFMDLHLVMDVLGQIWPWFVYAHYNDPWTLYFLLTGGVVFVLVLSVCLVLPREMLPAPRKIYIFWIFNLTGMLTSLGMIHFFNLVDIFYRGVSPELYILANLFERPPEAPDILGYTEQRRQISMADYTRQLPAGPKTKVILLVLESWAAFRTGAYGSPSLTTPNLDRLARTSRTFPNTVAVSAHSEYAQAAILSSLHPLKYSHHDDYKKIKYPRILLHNLLSALGYRTAAFSSQDERWMNLLGFVFNGDWDKFWFSLNFQGPHYGYGTQTKILDEYTIAEALNWIQQNKDRPFFLYLNFQLTHFPYDAPGVWGKVEQPTQPEFEWSFHSWPPGSLPVAIRRYDNSLRYMDAQVGKLLEGLRDMGLEQDTALVLVGDHGENLGPGAPPTHCCRLSPAELLPGMMIHAPDRVAPGLDMRVASTLDVAPTIAGILGIPPHPSWQGHDALAGSGANRAIHFAVDTIIRVEGVVEWPWKLSINYSKRTSSLVNMENDPSETRNLLLWGISPEMQGKVKAMAKKIEKFRACQLQYYSSPALFENFYVTCGD